MVNAIIAAADQLLERNEDPSKVSFEGVARSTEANFAAPERELEHA